MPKYTQEDLKKELIDSLEQSLRARQIKDVLNDLKKEGVIIPKSDHENVLRFILLLGENHPQLFDNHLKNQALHNFCRSCINKLNVAAEIKAGFIQQIKPHS